MSMEAVNTMAGKYTTTESYTTSTAEVAKVQQSTEQVQTEKTTEDIDVKSVGELELEEAITKIKELLKSKNISVEKVKEENTGLDQVVIKDKNGKVIKEMPPSAVLEIVNRAKQTAELYIINELV